jgi:hypothetical protein
MVEFWGSLHIHWGLAINFLITLNSFLRRPRRDKKAGINKKPPPARRKPTAYLQTFVKQT